MGGDAAAVLLRCEPLDVFACVATLGYAQSLGLVGRECCKRLLGGLGGR